MFDKFPDQTCAFEHVMLYTIFKVEPSTSFKTSQFMISVFP